MSEEEQTPATDPPTEEEASTKTGAEEVTEGEVKEEATPDVEGKYTPFVCFKFIFIVFDLSMFVNCLNQLLINSYT
jgi:hypothetical protein